jgi:hypothetical protein
MIATWGEVHRLMSMKVLVWLAYATASYPKSDDRLLLDVQVDLHCAANNLPHLERSVLL